MRQQVLDPKRVQQRLKPIYLGMLISLVLYSLVATMMAQNTPSELALETTTEQISVLYSSLAFSVCLLGMILNYILLKPRKIAQSRDPERAIQTVFMMTWACFNIATILGLVMVILSKNLEHYWSLFALSSLSMLSHPPNEGKIKRALNER